MTRAWSAVFHSKLDDWALLDHRLVMARVTIRLDFTDTAAIGPGKIQLLEAVEATGSIRRAAASAGMSFRQAWLLLQAIEDMFGDAVIVAARGGARGGGARLTPLGRSVVTHYRSAERAAGRAVRADLEALAAKVRPIEPIRPSSTPEKKSARKRKSLKKQQK